MNTAGRMSRMYCEAEQAPNAVRLQLDTNAAPMHALGEELRKLAPRAVVTSGRGSSDHAATFAKYLIETHAGVLPSSAAPSLSSVYEAKQDLQGVLFLAISQSGKSPDLLATAENAKAGGAHVVALCNSPDSPLSRMAHFAIDLCAGAETSVAATKSFITSLSAIVHLVGSWKGGELLEMLEQTPDLLERAWALDWNAAIPILQPAVNLFVVGRGHGLGVAQEAALKLKETCGLHAEAFSAAEVQHGPMALVGKGFPIFVFSQSDETRPSIEAMSRDFAARGAHVVLAGARTTGALTLPTLALPTHSARAVIEPILMIQSFYKLAATLATARGLDPDIPPHLRKVTETT